MIYRAGSHLIRHVVLLLVAGTLADYCTRQFTLNPNVIAVTWFIFYLGAFATYRWLGSSQSSFEAFQELTARARNYVFLKGITLAAIFAFILKSHRSTFIFTLSNVTAFFIVVIGIAGYYFASRSLAPVAQETAQPQWRGFNDFFLLGCVFVGTLFASVTYRASTDDMYYVNLSTYIYEHGVVPTRDTVLSNQHFNSYPRMSSWEVLWGVLARITHIHPGTLLYVLWVPFASALSYLVLARMFTAFGVKNIKTAMLASTLFLCFDGASGFTFGAYQGTRIWQGKSFFLSILLPLILIYILQILKSPNKRNLMIFFALNVAAVGATTTALILVPPMLMGAALIAIFRQRKALLPIAISGIYLLVMALTFRSMRTAGSIEVSAQGMGVGVRFAENSTGTSMPATYDMLTELAKPWWHAATIMLAIAIGWIALRAKFGRELVALNFAIWGMLCLPGLHEPILKLISATSIAWRFIWIVPIPMMIGAAASTLKDGIFARKTFASTSGLAYLWIGLLAVLPLTIGTPPWQIAPQSNLDAQLAKPTHWRDGFSFGHAWVAIQKVAQPKDVILARNGISSSLAVRTTKYFTVAPRDTYVRHATNGFHDGYPEERIKLALYVVGKEPVTYQPGEMQAALDHVAVNVVCLPQDRQLDIELFRSLGYVAAEAKGYKPGDKSTWFWCGRTVKYDH